MHNYVQLGSVELLRKKMSVNSDAFLSAYLSFHLASRKFPVCLPLTDTPLSLFLHSLQILTTFFCGQFLPRGLAAHTDKFLNKTEALPSASNQFSHYDQRSNLLK